MPTHYVYDATKTTELCQGDILSRTPALVALLDEYFPYYSRHRDYIYFMVLTQTCDLVSRDGAPCNSPYISLAAVRPIKDVVLMEASKHQPVKLQETNIVGNKAREKLAMFLESLMDNNKAGVFYLHVDFDVGITEPCCAFLQLSVSFRSVHYDKCLGAKIAQLKEPFQAKLGWLIGNMYSRVATTEWNLERPADKVGKVASKLLKQTIDNYDNEQIKVAIAELQSDGSIEAMTPVKIAEYVKKKELVPKLKQFKGRAMETMAGMKVLDPVKAMTVDALQNDDELKGAIATVIATRGEQPPEAAADEVLQIVLGKIHQVVDDSASPERDKYIADLVSDLMADNVLKGFIK